MKAFKKTKKQPSIHTLPLPAVPVCGLRGEVGDPGQEVQTAADKVRDALRLLVVWVSVWPCDVSKVKPRLQTGVDETSVLENPTDVSCFFFIFYCLCCVAATRAVEL